MNDKEKLAHWMMTARYATGHGDTMEDLLRELAWQMDERIEKAVAQERERCIAECKAEIDVEVSNAHPEYTLGREMGATLCMNRITALDKLNKAAEDNGEEL